MAKDRPPSHDGSDRTSWLRRAVWLEYFTVGWNVIEAGVAIAAGIMAGSIALIGFGLDSLIEVTAAGALLWRLRKELRLGQEISEDDHSALERRALLVVGITFFALALYILIDAGYNLITDREAEESIVGIVLAAVSLAVMPVLALLKQKTARALESSALASDAMETWICSYLSLVLLAGLVLNAAIGWSWADPVAALAMLPLIIKEGWEALEEAREED
ncbi:MAG: cation transporter [Actinomycetota bacterium]